MAIFLHSLEEQDPTKMPDIYQLPLKLWLCQKYNNGGMIWRIEREREKGNMGGERERERGRGGIICERDLGRTERMRE